MMGKFRGNRVQLGLFKLSRKLVCLGLYTLYAPLWVILRLLFRARAQEITHNCFPLMKIDSLVAASKVSLPIPFVECPLFILPDGVNILCPWQDAWIIEEIWKSDVYERFSNLKRGYVVIDVGAHVGIFTIKASREVGDKGLVIACEPHPTTYALLIANLNNNECKNVAGFNIALSDSRKETKLWLSPHGDGYGHSLVFKRSDKYVLVDVDTLDNMIRKIRLDHVDFIKIDVEGTELRTLKGAEKTIKKFKPRLSIAAYHTPTEAEEISEFLTSRGYKILVIDQFVYASWNEGSQVSKRSLLCSSQDS